MHPFHPSRPPAFSLRRRHLPAQPLAVAKSFPFKLSFAHFLHIHFLTSSTTVSDVLLLAAIFVFCRFLKVGVDVLLPRQLPTTLLHPIDRSSHILEHTTRSRRQSHTMPIRNPFTRRPGAPVVNDENLHPTTETSNGVSPPGFERVDTVGSKASSAMSVRSSKGQDNGEYKMSGMLQLFNFNQTGPFARTVCALASRVWSFLTRQIATPRSVTRPPSR